MQAIIIAGGKGTRLQELTHDIIPKPMVEICGKPLLQWQIENLRANGIDDIIIVVGHLKEQIKNYFPDLRYFEESEPLGTAGALTHMKDILADEFLLIYGDIFFDVDLQRMINFHHEHHAEGTLFVHPNSHPQDSNLIILGKSDQILDIIPKNTYQSTWNHNCVNAGIYIFNSSILKYFPYMTKIDLENDILPNFQQLYGYHSTEYVKDIGTVERFLQVEADIKKNIPFIRNLKNKQKAIFLDRDGTININVGLVSHPSQFELLPWAAEAIKLINQSGYLAIVVTNQSVVARGLCSIKKVDYIHAKMEEVLSLSGAYLDDIFFCPHHPDKGYPEENSSYKIKCNCRKPKPGMFYAAADRYNIDLSQSWMIGDTEIDRQAAINAGVQPVITNNLLSAVKQILKE